MLKRTKGVPEKARLKRTKFAPTDGTTAVAYYDMDHKYRWGMLVREGPNNLVVQDIFGVRTSVPKNKVITRKTVDPSHHTLEYVLHGARLYNRVGERRRQNTSESQL